MATDQTVLPAVQATSARSRAAKHGDVRIGISGWTYAPWRGVFYPNGLAQAQELEFASGQFRSIEINGTFYRAQRPESFADWASRTPEDFVFSVKAPRFITHIRRLKDVATPLANFFASGLLRLGEKLGPVLWQFPPNFRFDADRISAFLAMLPHHTEAAAQLARQHDERFKDRLWTETDAKRPVRHAIEIRHESFRNPHFIDLLRRHDVALVCADTVAWPRLMDVTADFVYCRLHGSEELYASGYDGDALDAWCDRVASWARGKEPADADRIGPPADSCARDVFVYFDNDTKVRAPHDAADLVARVSQRLEQRQPG
jgi:uncharacterized protein YecE (DUF72 family)